MNPLAKAVREHRKLSGLTQVDLAQLAGVSRKVVQDLERGKEGIQLDSLGRILGVLNLELELRSPLGAVVRLGPLGAPAGPDAEGDAKE